MGSSVVKVKMKMLRSLLALAILSSQGQSSTTVHSSPSDTVHVSRQARDTLGRFPTPGQVQRERSLLDRYNQQKALISRFPVFDQTGNLVQQSKAMDEAAKALFEYLGGNKQAQLTFDITFETSPCLGRVEDVLALMDEIIKLVEDNEPEIAYLEKLVENLKFEKDINKQITGSSKMVRALGHLMPSLTSRSARLCISSPEDSVRSFKSLAQALINIKNHKDVHVDDIARKHLEFSAQVMKDTATFLIQLHEIHKEFKLKCHENRMKDSAVSDTMIDFMASLAEFFRVLGFEDKIVAIKDQILFVKRITRPFEDLTELGVLDTTLTCDFEHGSYEELALTLDDIGELIKNVGLHTLSQYLGIDFELGLINQL